MAAGLEIYNSVLNQLGSPAIYSDVFANRPAAGYTGRLFVSTDTNELYRDTGTSWVLIGAGGGGGGITSLNGLNASSQIFATATTGTDFTISSSGFTHTFALPDASLTARGVVSTAAQSFAGQKTFNTSVSIGSQTANSSHILSSGTAGLAWTASNFAIPAAIPNNTILISNVGTYSTLTGTGNILIGVQAGLSLTTGTNNTFIGRNTGRGILTGTNNVILGYSDATNLPTSSTNIQHLLSGYGYRNNDASTIPSSKHVFIGGGFDVSSAQTTYFFGQMPFTADAASVGITFHAPSGSGTNITGASYTIASGRNTGNGNGGQLNLSTSTPGASGTTLGTLTNRVQISGTGAFIGIHQSPGVDAVSINGNTLVSNGYFESNTNFPSIGSGGTYSTFSNNAATYQSSFVTSGGIVYGSLLSSDIKTFNSGTVNQDSFVTSGFSGLYITFATSGATVTVSQPATGIRSITGHNIYTQFRSGSTTGTVTNLSGLQINGFDNQSASAITVDNGYGIIINSLTEYTGTATITNRWGLFQNGASDNNYFAGSVNIGSTTLNASALLAISSTTQGFLLPRMTDTQKTSIGTPASGLMVYDTVNLAPSYYNGTSWVNLGTGGGGGITSLNGLTASTQTFATGTSGTDVNWSSATSTHTLNIPDASLTARGLVTTGSQSFNGQKTFRGTGTTSATTTLLVQDSAAATVLECRNDKTIFIGNNASGGTLQNNTQLRFISSGNTNGSFTFSTGTGNIDNNNNLIVSTTGVNATTGSNDINYLRLTGALNTTGTNTSIIRDINLNHTFTSITGSYRAIDIVAPATVTGGGTITYFIARTASATIFQVQPTTITIGDAVDIVLNTTTGTKIGTSTSQKLSLWNASPIVQPTTAVGSATYASPGAGSTVKTDDTFDGYTLQQVVKALRNIGILA